MGRYWQYPQKWDVLVQRARQFLACLLVGFSFGLLHNALVSNDLLDLAIDIIMSSDVRQENIPSFARGRVRGINLYWASFGIETTDVLLTFLVKSVLHVSTKNLSGILLLTVTVCKAGYVASNNLIHYSGTVRSGSSKLESSRMAFLEIFSIGWDTFTQ